MGGWGWLPPVPAQPRYSSSHSPGLDSRIVTSSTLIPTRLDRCLRARECGRVHPDRNQFRRYHRDLRHHGYGRLGCKPAGRRATLGASKSADFVVQVAIPSIAGEGDSDVAVFTVRSASVPSVFAEAELTTTAAAGKIFMPLVLDGIPPHSLL